MASYVTDPELQRTLGKTYGIRGLQDPLVLSNILQPVTIAHDLTDQDIFADSPYRRRYSRFVNTQGDATHPPVVWMNNPVGSNSIIIIRRIALDQATGVHTVGYVQGPLTPTSTVRGGGLNGRTPQMKLSEGVFSIATNLAPPAYEAGVSLLGSALDAVTGQLIWDELNIVIEPGTRLVVLEGASNAAQLRTWWMWDEIPLTRAV